MEFMCKGECLRQVALMQRRRSMFVVEDSVVYFHFILVFFFFYWKECGILNQQINSTFSAQWWRLTMFKNNNSMTFFPTLLNM